MDPLAGTPVSDSSAAEYGSSADPPHDAPRSIPRMVAVVVMPAADIGRAMRDAPFRASAYGDKRAVWAASRRPLSVKQAAVTVTTAARRPACQPRRIPD